jgi:cytochrome c-type biogenesis protein CcmE
MTARRRRMLLIGLVLAGVIVSATFALRAFRENLSYFFSPTEVAAGQAPASRNFRLGGMVVDGSLSRAPGSLTVDFVVTDFAHSIPVRYTGVLPDLFREGSGVVARGRLDASGRFEAQEIVAKHDENYMPPEVAEALKKGKAQAGASSTRTAAPAPGAFSPGPGAAETSSLRPSETSSPRPSTETSSPRPSTETTSAEPSSETRGASPPTASPEIAAEVTQ